MTKFPPDRFDRVPDDLRRIGAHRMVPPRGRVWIIAAWAVGSAAVLIVVGAIALTVTNSRVAFTPPEPVASGPSTTSPVPTRTPTATPTPTLKPVLPTVAPTMAIEVLNGTSTSGLASRAVRLLVADGWTGDVTAETATTDDFTQTVVYYHDASQEGAALGVARSLGVGRSELVSVTNTPGGGDPVASGMTVVLGSDFDTE